MQIANANPHVTVTGRHLAITAAIHDYARKKIESLHLDYPRIIEAHVILEVDKYRHRADIVLICCNHITIEASEESSDLYASLDQVMTKIARRMRKYKTRLLRTHRPRRSESIRYLPEQVIPAEALESLDARFDSLLATQAGGTNGQHDHAANAAAASAPAAPAPAPKPSVRTEQFALKPMFVDEALLQMEVAERDFLVFHNALTDRVNVLYRRRQGDFGLIDPVLS